MASVRTSLTSASKLVRLMVSGKSNAGQICITLSAETANVPSSRSKIVGVAMSKIFSMAAFNIFLTSNFYPTIRRIFASPVSLPSMATWPGIWGTISTRVSSAAA